MAQPNRLLHETSPYLLQHAYNPVDWYPWGAEALARAQAEDKPLLLSVGYAACHWCHVMEHESFEDEATAALMNAHFVNVKVDREERPDVDSIYMTAVVAMTRHGGWPMTVFLLPDGTPFYGGTYFPPDAKAAQYRMPSFKQVLTQIAELYATRRDELITAGRELVAHMNLHTTRALERQALTPAVLDAAYATLRDSYEPEYGGFGDAPKFPQPMTLEFLLRVLRRTGDNEARTMLDHTLHRMALGGMYDQLGGGFHRYSVDARWLVPHFEKMLYDNALLARLYTEAHQVTGEPFYRRIAEETLAYLLREMRHPQGGFYSTQDADSPTGEVQPNGKPHKEEGVFFIWTPAEVRELLGADAGLFCQVFDVTNRGNFEGRNILHLPRPLADVARVTGTDEASLAALVERGRARLFAAREQRPKPDRDEKILTAWNGMALRALAAAAAAFASAEYRAAAQANAAFVLDNLRRADGRLLRSWKDGQATLLAYLEDYALLADGLLALYALDANPRWLAAARELADSMLALFWDEETSALYDTASDHEQLVTRPRDVSDNATPSGTSVAVDVLLRLAALTGNEVYQARAQATLEQLVPMMGRFAVGAGRLLCAADFALARVHQVALVGDVAAPDLHALHAVLHEAYRPYVVVAYGTGADAPDLSLLHNRDQIDGRATAYVCEGFACQMPTTDPDTLRTQLGTP